MVRHVGGNREIAEDVVQEAFARALKFYPSFDFERGKFSSWFNSILYNALRDVQNQNKSTVEIEVADYNAEDILNMGSEGMTDEMRAVVVSSLKAVKNQKHRRVLELFYTMGYSSKEIAMIERDVTQSNVTTVVMRFKNSLCGVS